MDKFTTPCAACKHLKRKCTQECVLAPYFPTNKQSQYTAVHKVFGASHVATIVNDVDPSQREVAMNSIVFEAQVRQAEPIYGCTAIIHHLQCQIKDLENQLAIVKKELASYKVVPNFVPVPPITYQQVHYIPMAPAMSNNSESLFRTQLLHDETQRFASTQNAQMQQTEEVEENERVMHVRDEKILSKI